MSNNSEIKVYDNIVSVSCEEYMVLYSLITKTEEDHFMVVNFGIGATLSGFTYNVNIRDNMAVIEDSWKGRGIGTV